MNDETELSISEREAEQQYPTQYWEGTKIKRSFDVTTDDLQDAYMRGREAEPCDEQIEAVAKILACSYLTCAQRNNLMQIAKRLLDAARKAVM